jgi:stage II sporulation protein D (peptidoglycan lytic transglycosylase)
VSLRPTFLLALLLATQVWPTQNLASQLPPNHVVPTATLAPDLRIGVLGLFRPHRLTLRPAPGQALIVATEKSSFVLDGSSGYNAADIAMSDGQLLLRVGDQMVRADHIRATSRNGAAADLVLAIPDKISRRYRGVLQVEAVSGALVPVVGMNLETAVASAVQAESDPDAPLETLKAQAVATRSYFVAARGRHHNFDFCDTTHCQFLREPPGPESNAFRATLATRGLVLEYHEQAVQAMFSRSCGGRTRTPQELGIASHGYPYFSVVCDYCRRHPVAWTRRVSPTQADDLLSRGEASRLDIDRRLGWDFVPSDNFTTHREARSVLLHGTGRGHGIGLCQQGAKAMAQAGAGFREILSHYYPNTELTTANPQRLRTAAMVR